MSEEPPSRGLHCACLEWELGRHMHGHLHAHIRRSEFRFTSPRNTAATLKEGTASQCEAADHSAAPNCVYTTLIFHTVQFRSRHASCQDGNRTNRPTTFLRAPRWVLVGMHARCCVTCHRDKLMASSVCTMRGEQARHALSTKRTPILHP